MKKWMPSLIMWLASLVILTNMFIFIYSNDDLLIIGACICAFIILSILLVFIGFGFAPEKEDKKYKRYKDFLEWYEKQKEKEMK